MRVHMDDDFDLEKIAESGQCFRWERTGEGAYLIPHRRRRLHIEQRGGGEFELGCSAEEFHGVWRAYFDLDEDYRAVRALVDAAVDPYLFEAAEAQQGIRILRQDPWEVVVSFIISQNRNIPAIKRSVELLCEAAGEWVPDDGPRGGFFAFPTPEAILSLGDEALASCRLGYRDSYVRAAAEDVSSGRIDLDWLASADPDIAIESLMSMKGVGIKVASCIALFGLHCIDAFPIDTWIKKVLESEYPDGFLFERYRPYNGIFQQYLFAHYRNATS